MKVLVIGGTMFIGRYIVNELLTRGHEVIVYHRGRHECKFPVNVKHIHGDRRDYTHFKEDMAKILPEGVVDVIPLYPSDSKTLVECFSGRICSLVHISTCSVYNTKAVIPFSEGEQHLVDDIHYTYAYSKRLCEKIILEIQKKVELPCTILRLPAVYGPYDYLSREWFIVKRILDRRKQIIIPDGGFTLIHQCYVEDAAKAVAMALENPPLSKVRIYNVGHEHILSLKQITHLISTIFNYEWEEVDIPAELLPYRHPYAFLRHLFCDINKIKQELGFKETISIEQGMRNTVAWLCKNPQTQKYNTNSTLFDYDLEDKIVLKYKKFRQLIKKNGPN